MGEAVSNQIKMVFRYAQMTFVENVEEFMTTASSAARVYPPAVREYKKLKDTIKLV